MTMGLAYANQANSPLPLKPYFLVRVLNETRGVALKDLSEL